MATAAALLPQPAMSQQGGNVPWPTPGRPAYPASPYHGMVDGDGRVIPCRCRYQGRDFRLGEQVCMSTHVGVVLTRCDLLMNNTSWVPTETACTISALPPASVPALQLAGQR